MSQQQGQEQANLAPAAGAPGEGRREGESQHTVDPMAAGPGAVSLGPSKGRARQPPRRRASHRRPRAQLPGGAAQSDRSFSAYPEHTLQKVKAMAGAAVDNVKEQGGLTAPTPTGIKDIVRASRCLCASAV